MKQVLIVLLSAAALWAEHYYDRGKLITLTPANPPVSINSRAQISAEWFRTESGQIVGTTNEIIVQWKQVDVAPKVMKSLGITTFQWLTKTMVLVTVPQGADLFDLSRKLSDHSATTFAHPNLLRERSLR